MPDHRVTYLTRLGACLSVVTILLLLAYGAYKINVLIGQDEYTLYMARQDNHYSEMEPLTMADGF